MKIVNKLLVLVMLFTLAFAGNAFAATSGDYEYMDNGDGTATITGYLGTATNLVIPSSVDGLTVTSIGASAFENKSLTSVVIPSSVKIIEQWAFASSDIQSVTFNTGLESIGDWAFYGNSITTLELPSSLMNLGFGAFQFNTSLTNVKVLSNTVTFGTQVFYENQQGGSPADITLQGYLGSTTETYATANGHNFSELAGTPPEPVSKDVTVTGNVYATVLDFSVPLEVTFVIDPNQSNPQDRFISPVLTVQNLTNAPVKLSIASFEMKQESIDKGFQSVAPSLYSDDVWSKLNKADSKKLAVGIKANNNWQHLDNASSLYANGFSNQVIGTIAANATADFVFEAKHGNAFDKAETIKYTVSFVIELD